eukprot:GHVP01019839.1.p1 GENE.GHVP01019839.1~~GHVP01019839.1.p1  ORF type:complete len:378 (+),score=76.32 GHVP01019839.1:225-1358(+)
MQLTEKPTAINLKQAVSAVGQCCFMRMWETLFGFKNVKIAQVLITRGDLMDKERFLNFKNTLQTLLSLDVIPVLNENDTVATSQLRLGDNDTLASYCAVSLSGRMMVLLSDVDYLYTANPRLHSDARPIPYVGRMDDVFRMVREDENEGSKWGSGGMWTKLNAAKIASAAGVETSIINGKDPFRLLKILDWLDSPREAASDDDLSPAHLIGRGMEVGVVTCPKGTPIPYVGTVFAAQRKPQTIQDQRKWILSLPSSGQLFVDLGAAKALVVSRSSLLPVGITWVTGSFPENSVVGVFLDSDSISHVKPDESLELARCLINFSSDDLKNLKGKHSKEIPGIIPGCLECEVASRTNIMLVNPFAISQFLTKDERRKFLG